jgi:hypothetical protein
MKEYLLKKLIESTFFRVKSVPVVKYGYWWFKKLNDHNFNLIVDKVFKFEDSV